MFSLRTNSNLEKKKRMKQNDYIIQFNKLVENKIENTKKESEKIRKLN